MNYAQLYVVDFAQLGTLEIEKLEWIRMLKNHLINNSNAIINENSPRFEELMMDDFNP